MITPAIFANWKLNKTNKDTVEFVKEFAPFVKELQNKVQIGIAAPFTALDTLSKELKINGLDQVVVTAQDISQYDSGAYTGEISAEMLKEIGVQAVLVGHSERREIFAENDEIIRAKLEKVLAAGLKLVFCCGESLETRENNQTDTWIAAQVKSAFEGLDVSHITPGQIIVAYEPIWAIGTGKTCDSVEANRVIANLRNELAKYLPVNIIDATAIQYGGSVKPATIEEQMNQDAINGALVGGASLKSTDFSQIVAGSVKVTV